MNDTAKSYQIFKGFSLVDVFYHQEVEGISSIEWEWGQA